MLKDEKLRASNHRSKEHYLFDNTFAEELKDIKSFCEHQLKNYLEEIEGVDIDLVGLRITQSWLNITKPDESHHPHSHANSYLSGVFYFQCLPDDSIIFVNPMHGFYNNNIEFQTKKSTEGNSNAVRVNIKKPRRESNPQRTQQKRNNNRHDHVLLVCNVPCVRHRLHHTQEHGAASHKEAPRRGSDRQCNNNSSSSSRPQRRWRRRRWRQRTAARVQPCNPAH